MAALTTLLINPGDLPGLAALALRRDPEQVVQWFPAAGGGRATGGSDAALTRKRLECVQQQHTTYLTANLVIAEHAMALPDAGPLDPLLAAALLLEAARSAREFGCRTIIWPLRLGPDWDVAQTALDVLSHVRCLCALETVPTPGVHPSAQDVSQDRSPRRKSGSAPSAQRGSTPALTIEAPLLDLTCQQVVELADDQAAPLHLCWPFAQSEPADAQARAHDPHAAAGAADNLLVKPWRDAFETLGIDWPWPAAELCAMS